MKKKCLIFVLLMVLLFPFQVVSAEVDYTKEADMLNSLGLFNGTQNGYELNRVPTRVESAAMLVRLLGAEKEANEMKYGHPFTDIPEWANNIVGYMYEKGFTQGIGNNQFGSSQTTIARDYTTFMLRSLGYSSSSDFNYLESIDFASSKGIITQDDVGNLSKNNFKRNEMVLLSYRTLNANMKDSDSKLISKLYNNGSINKLEAIKQDLVNSYEVAFEDIDSSLGKLELKSDDVYIYAEKQEIDNGYIFKFGSEGKLNLTNGYKGRIEFSKDISNWEDSKSKFEISFYNKEEFVKKIEFLTYFDTEEEDFSCELITPYDKFDEIRVTARPIDNNEIKNNLEGIFEIITIDETNLLKETIIKYGNANVGTYGSNSDFNSVEVINTFAWDAIFGGVTTYNDGKVFRPFAYKYQVDGDFTLEFSDIDSYIDDAKRILYIPKNDFNEINFILVFDEGYKTEKAFIVK